MKIRGIFSKPIDRNIQGVIKVGQTNDSYIQQELEEYVVTSELKKHFKVFFDRYIEGITGGTDKIGVWISGFFGSGKSHFLKILSYLLENREAGGKKAIDYFRENGKIDDNFLMANMTRAASEAENADVILFNIDSKNSSVSGDERDPIVSVFLRVFNEMQGYCGQDPHIANLERRLEEQGKLEGFKKIILAKEGRSWEKARYDVGFIQDSIIDAIEKVGLMSHEAAQNWCEKITAPYTISNEDFALLVKKYLDQKGKNHRIIFMVDEMGQFIGQESRLMLNLQTLVEDLGTVCQGRAWVLVTSQEDIDSITQNMAARSNDFSKIQGRFETRLSLSSADVGEVIRKRILEKTDPAFKALSLLYENKATVIKNLIVFGNTAQKKLYENSMNFAADYPFVPYQFDLLGNVLTAIRQHGASGKHLAQGERSMIALFKESAIRLSGEDIGPLVPFNLFYDALDQFLDSGHRGVILSALRNGRINPANKDSILAVDVLKTLFLIKYVKEITATFENITSLMCTSIDEDRLALTKNIQEALRVLQEETLVYKNGDIYVFLTNEEQEVNREVERQNISSAEVLHSASEIIFDDIIGDNKYKLSEFNGRYSYSYNQKIDDLQYNPRQNHPVTLHILTPDSGQQADTSSLLLRSSQVSGVLMVLPQRIDFLVDLRRHLCIERYLRSGAYQTLQRANEIEAELQKENDDRKKAARSLLEDALREARIFVNGNEENYGGKDIKSRINGALGTVVSSVYHKLSYIDKALGIENIRNLFSQDAPVLIPGGTPNRYALDDVRSFIESNSQKHQKTSMRTLQERFMKEPYGFVEDDVEWLCARLFKDGDIDVYVNNAQITVQDKTDSELVNYFTKKQYADSLTAEIRRKANDAQLRVSREIMKALFNDSAPNDDEDALFRKFKQQSQTFLRNLEDLLFKYKECPEYPGKSVIDTGIGILQVLRPILSPFSFFGELSQKKDDILDFSDDYENIKTFFSGSQSGIFAEAVKAKRSFERNVNFISDGNASKIIEDIDAIVNKPNPYKEIYKLPELTDKYFKAVAEQCNKDRVPLLAVLENYKKGIIDRLDGKPYKDELIDPLNRRFDAMERKIKECAEPSVLKSINYEIDRINTESLDKIDLKETGLNAISQRDAVQRDTVSMTDEFIIRITRHVSIRTLVDTPSWRMETADDVKRHLSELEHRITAEMKDDDILSVEF